MEVSYRIILNRCCILSYFMLYWSWTKDYIKSIKERYLYEKRVSNSSSVRLIDANKLRYEAETCLETTEDFQELIDNQPTIEI